MDTVKLSNGVEMPILGYGVYQVSPSECERCVKDAISAGYRLIDTAQAYGNEQNVGNAIRNCGVPREELFIVTKVWISNAGYERAKPLLMNLYANFRPTTSTCYSFISRSAIITAHGVQWRKRTRLASCVPSAYQTSIPTASSTWRSSAKYRLWSIRWKRTCSTNR